jgi:hypothetical protein
MRAAVHTGSGPGGRPNLGEGRAAPAFNPARAPPFGVLHAI